MKRIATILWLAVALPGADKPYLSADHIAVVCHCSVAAYGEALAGAREVLERDPQTIDLDTAPPGELAASARRDPARVFIAIGQDALAAAANLKPPVAVIATMVLHGEASPLLPAAEIDLDVPPKLLIQELKRVFPQYARVGLLASGNTDRTAFFNAAKDAGVQLQVKEVAGAADLNKSLLSLKGRVDLVLVLPDNSLYNNATVQALILASLEYGVPVVGFSATFVRAGAAAGVYADFRDAGRQAAEAALHLDPAHALHSAEQPRKLTIAMNQRVIRLLGLNYDHSVVFTVFR